MGHIRALLDRDYNSGSYLGIIRYRLQEWVISGHYYMETITVGHIWALLDRGYNSGSYQGIIR